MYYSDGSYDNLGLIIIYGSCSAEVLKDLLQKMLSSFKINLSDVLAVTKFEKIWERVMIYVPQIMFKS